MRQRGYGRDPELTFRMSFSVLMLVYVAFMGLLFWAGIPWMFILGLAIVMAAFQYYGSDKIVLMTTGARSEGRRDNAAEMRMGAIMEEEGIPVERNLEGWYSLSGNPFQRLVREFSRGLFPRR